MEYKGQNNLIGKKFNKLTVLEYAGNSKWLCQCDCGNTSIVKTASLNSGKTKSCGCLRGENTKNNTRNSKPKQDLTGKQFGYLTALYYIKGGKWHCKCKCGNEVDVDTRNLNSNHTLSCGCYQKEQAQKNVIDMSNYEDKNFLILSRAGSSTDGVALWECLCKNCGNVFITKGSNIRSVGIQTCGCSHSKGEQKISELLTEAGYNFKTQYTFNDLIGVNGGLLRFDFAIFENDQLKQLIEFNGIQHYQKPQGHWGEEWETLLIHDKKKIEYCQKNNIPLKILKYDEPIILQNLIL